MLRYWNDTATNIFATDNSISCSELYGVANTRLNQHFVSLDITVYLVQKKHVQERFYKNL